MVLDHHAPDGFLFLPATDAGAGVDISQSGS